MRAGDYFEWQKQWWMIQWDSLLAQFTGPKNQSIPMVTHSVQDLNMTLLEVICCGTYWSFKPLHSCVVLLVFHKITAWQNFAEKKLWINNWSNHVHLLLKQSFAFLCSLFCPGLLLSGKLSVQVFGVICRLVPQHVLHGVCTSNQECNEHPLLVGLVDQCPHFQGSNTEPFEQNGHRAFQTEW